MKCAVIDIGSNSVRLMLSENGKTLYKLVEITALAEGLGQEKTLKPQPVDRTVSAVCFFVEHAKNQGVSDIMIFATAAVRYAENKQYFIDEIKTRTGLVLDVISGEEEAYIGRLGALGFGDGGIIDIGGASAEITAVKEGKQVYSKSLDLGVVKIKDACLQDKNLAKQLVEKKIAEYGYVPKTTYYGIGGTATSLASMIQELDPYDPSKVDGYVLTKQVLQAWVDKLYSLTVEQREKLKGLQPKRASVVAGGALLLLEIMNKIGIDSITVSEKDNLEGYLINKRGKNE